jgi:hypothetical protein
MADPWAYPSGNVLRNALNYLPSRQDVALTLGAPVDATAYLLGRMGVPVPIEWTLRSANPEDNWFTGSMLEAQRLLGLRSDTKAAPAYSVDLVQRPSAAVPFGSAFFENALSNPPSLSQLYNALRAVKPFP